MSRVLQSLWDEIKEAYQRGEGSCRVLADRFEVSEQAVENRCKREGWRKEMAEVTRMVTEKVVHDLSQEVKNRLRRCVTGFDRDFDRIEGCYDQMDDIVDPVGLKCLVQARKVIVEGFQSLGAVPMVKGALTPTISSSDVLGLLVKISQLAPEQKAKLNLPDPRIVDIEVEE